MIVTKIRQTIKRGNEPAIIRTATLYGSLNRAVKQLSAEMPVVTNPMLAQLRKTGEIEFEYKEYQVRIEIKEFDAENDLQPEKKSLLTQIGDLFKRNL